MKIILKGVIIVLLFFHINCMYARNKHKVYNASIKYLDGQKIRCQLILATDSSLIVLTTSKDTLNILATDIKIFTPKRKFKHKRTSLLTFSGLAFITGIYIYSDYKPQGYDLGRSGSAVVGGLYIGHGLALPTSLIIIGLKELSIKNII